MSIQETEPPATDPRWNEALLRVESYLRAHRVAPPLALHRLAATVIARAWIRAAGQPQASPVALAMREADDAITAWFGRVLAPDRPHARRLGVRGRLALALADVPGRWPAHFLASGEPPADLAATMREAYLHGGPLPRPLKMSPRPLDLGPTVAACARLWAALRESAALRWLRRIALVAAAAGLLLLALRR